MQRRAARAGQQREAGEAVALFEHQVDHAPPADPVHGTHHVRHDVARVAVRPDRALPGEAGIGVPAPRGDRARLHEDEARAVPYPFDVVGGIGIVERLRRVAQQAAERERLRVVEQRCGVRFRPRFRFLRAGRRERFLPRAAFRRRDDAHALPGGTAGDDGQRFADAFFLEQDFLAAFQSADQRFAEAAHGADRDAVVASAPRVAGEGDAGEDGRQHGHDDDGHRGVGVGQPEALAVGDGLRRP